MLDTEAKVMLTGRMDKQCTVCLQTKPLSEFYRSKVIYYMSHCKECDHIKCAKYRKTDGGKRAYARGSKKWGKTTNGRSHLRAAWNKYHKTENGKAKAYLYEQKDRVKAKRSAWKRSESGKVSAANYAHGRRRCINISGYKLTVLDWYKIKEHYKNCCAYCKNEFDKLTIDHVVPLSRGGLHEYDNIVPSCGPCNRSKGKKLLSEWHGRTYV
jgi:5-methylcytosine-specific restriction endonuclease McrA